MPDTAQCCRNDCTLRGELHLHHGQDYTGGTFCSWSHLAEWLATEKPEDQLGVPWWPPTPAGRHQ